ncbi:GNAT family N-acetyltransferase [Nisaea acidiphila]|uniref:GNAT family N-acetyltransferase n=1 Tax=Nisaea acidiphila TaxID=1862145 RepID=A0A9J7APY1_9PROT|nr:GNAT family N-acetyltransferase [Nisaea acidiphila]UUX49456.1 GNAT family N-acetyltransferase [Nisaea acidiphila]
MPLSEIIKPDAVLIRSLEETDSIPDLTSMLHRAYGRLARMGLRYMATHQGDDVTRERIAEGTCLVAVMDGEVVGTIIVKTPEQTNGCAWYDRPEVASVGQFGVEPDIQAKGLGLMLLDEAERRVRAAGAAEIALDTAEPATHLVAWYTRLGYRFIQYQSWEQTNYRSVIMSKALTGAVS